MENFYSLMGGDENYRSWLSIARPTLDYSGVYCWSPCINFGIDDVFSYINIGYSSPCITVGGGHSNAIDWYAELAFKDHTHSEYASTSHSHNYLSTDGGDTTGTIAVTKDIGVGNYSYVNCHFVANAPTNTSSSSRAGYGFHDMGVNGCEVYLDTDGDLKMMANNAYVYKIINSSHFTVSGNTLTIYL